MERVFVYGTLRRGDCRDLTAHYPGAKFLSTGWIEGELFHLGEYPGVRLSGTTKIVGEIFEVPAATLAQLDTMEGEEYSRETVAVNGADGTVSSCWVYEVGASVCVGSPRIAGGDWFGRWV